MRLIDTHCHFNHRDLERDLSGVLRRAQGAGVQAFIVVGYDLPTSRRAVELAREHPNVFATVGIHPHSATTCDEAAMQEIEALAAEPKVVAIGEIGLDFYRDLSPRPAQYEALLKQYTLAQKLSLPVVFHCRDAYPELLDWLEQEETPPLPAVLHCFGGSQEDAGRALERGLYLGVDGPVTFKSAESLRVIVEAAPLERLLIETDAPYLAPHPYRGKTNEPAYLPLVAQMLAQVKNETPERIAEATWKNAHALFTRLGDGAGS